MTSQIAARRTRFGRASRPPVRYEPEETPLDDGSDVETADANVDVDDLESDTSCGTETESEDDEEEAGSLEDFVVPDAAGVVYESSSEDDEEQSGGESEVEDPMSD